MFFARILLFLILSIGPACALEGWHLSTFMGGSMSFPNHLKLNLEGLPDQSKDAIYSNKSFSDSHWWSFRLEDWHGERGSGLELIHHKIYLANTNDVIHDFSISDGYNLAYYNFAWKTSPSDRVRLGLGLAFGHMDATLGDRPRFHTSGLSGHFLAGPTVQFNYEKWLWENDTNFISLDTKLTLAYARVPVSRDRREYADAPDIALHLSLGVGSKPKALSGDLVSKALYFAPLAYPYLTGKYILGTGLTP